MIAFVPNNKIKEITNWVPNLMISGTNYTDGIFIEPQTGKRIGMN